MAFQLSNLAARVSLSKHLVLITENNFPRSLKFSSRFASYWPRCSFHTVVVRSGEGSLNITRGLNSSQRVINTVKRAENFATATTSASSKSFEWPSLKGWKRGGKLSRSSVVVLLGLSAAVVASCVHSSAVCAMAAQAGVDLDLDSERTDWNMAKTLLLSMSPEEKRKYYKSAHISLDHVAVWKHGAASDEPLYKVNDELNQKISLFRGDITKLEIDAIVNAEEDEYSGPQITDIPDPDSQKGRGMMPDKSDAIRCTVIQ